MRKVYFLLLPHAMSLNITGPMEEVLTLASGLRLYYIGPQSDVVTFPV
ncbi:MAG: hypothetical protein GPOALKHO_001756 [Sodalis sp.]|nr:MAG: hypothetical protein GPOALKHO_001756 [Sodalis sp.]